MQTATPTPFLQSLAIQMRVIGALMTRELLASSGRRNIGFLWLFVSPMIFTALITGMHYLTGGRSGRSGPADIPWVAIGITGFSFFQLMRGLPTDCSNVIKSSRKFLLHRHVRILDLFFARILMEIFTVTFSLVLLTSSCVFFGLIKPPNDLLGAIVAWLLLAWLAASLGLVFGPLLVKFPLLKRVWMVYSWGCMIFSGALFLVDWLPYKYQQVALWMPPVHGMEMLREGYFGNAVRAHYSISYLISWAVCLTFVGLVFARASHVEAENQ